jgi:hypothetical protein
VASVALSNMRATSKKLFGAIVSTLGKRVCLPLVTVTNSTKVESCEMRMFTWSIRTIIELAFLTSACESDCKGTRRACGREK